MRAPWDQPHLLPFPALFLQDDAVYFGLGELLPQQAVELTVGYRKTDLVQFPLDLRSPAQTDGGLVCSVPQDLAPSWCGPWCWCGFYLVVQHHFPRPRRPLVYYNPACYCLPYPSFHGQLDGTLASPG